MFVLAHGSFVSAYIWLTIAEMDSLNVGLI